MSAKSIVRKKAIAKKVKRLILLRIVSDRLRVSSGQGKKGILRGEGGKCRGKSHRGMKMNDVTLHGSMKWCEKSSDR